MSVYLISDEPLEGWQKFLGDSIRELSGHQVESLAVIVLPKDYASEDGYTMSGYYNMSLTDLQVAMGQIQSDIIERTVKANLQSWLEELESGEEEEWTDT